MKSAIPTRTRAQGHHVYHLKDWQILITLLHTINSKYCSVISGTGFVTLSFCVFYSCVCVRVWVCTGAKLESVSCNRSLVDMEPHHSPCICQTSFKKPRSLALTRINETSSLAGNHQPHWMADIHKLSLSNSGEKHIISKIIYTKTVHLYILKNEKKERNTCSRELSKYFLPQTW